MNERTFDNDSIDDQPLPWGNYLAGAKVLIFFAPLYWKLAKSQEIYLPKITRNLLAKVPSSSHTTSPPAYFLMLDLPSFKLLLK
jgi:hypothetical protein